MPTFTSPFTGTVVEPTDVSYYQLTFGETTPLVWPQVANGTDVPASRIMDCYPTASNLQVILPPGNQGAVGTDILFRNLGGVAFSINDVSLDASVVLNPGESKYFYLVDNADVDGVWHNVTFGTGTSSADAASLQSYGLTTISGKLATTENIVRVSSSPTLDNTSRAATYVWEGGLGSFTLPLAATISSGWYIQFRNNGTGTLQINPQETSLINGVSNITLNPGDSGLLAFESSTGNFFTIGLTPASSAAFTSATYDVDSIVGNTLNLVSYAPIIQTYVALSNTRTTTLNIVLPAITQIYVLSNATSSGGYNLSFNITGSSSPPVVLSAGSVAIVLSDGNTLYILSQTLTGVFSANDGSASAPTFTFNNDQHTGLYLAGTSVLGISANSVNMLLIDNTNTLAPLISTNARFKAGLINGGTF